MKKILKNKKGFTLVELLAVIVILAIIMVIATQQIGKVIAGARADSFVESYQMVERQVKTYISSDQTGLITCDDEATQPKIGADGNQVLGADGKPEMESNKSEYCSTKGNYGLSSNDYKLKVTKGTGDDDDKYIITLTATSDGKFTNMDLTKNGKASDGTICVTTNISSGVTECNSKEIKGSVEIND